MPYVKASEKYLGLDKEKLTISTIEDKIISKIFIVTPSYNAHATISRTINSVVSQAGDFDIYYHIQDGGSTDDTLSIIKKWDKLLTNGSYPISCNSVTITTSSAPDEGMYDAIVKGFDIALPKEDGWISWINADDYYMQGAFATIDKINKSSHLPKTIQWVTGASAINKGTVQLFSGNRMLSKEVINAGLADGEHWDFIQQEGTFFKRSLWDKVNKTDGFANLQYAGDWNLWRQFSQYTDIYQFKYPLASFSIIEGQLSQTARLDYEKETETIISKEKRLNFFKTMDTDSIKSLYLSASCENNLIEIEQKSINVYYNQRVEHLKLADQYKKIDFINDRESLIKQLNQIIEQQKEKLSEKQQVIDKRNQELGKRKQELSERKQELSERKQELGKRKQELSEIYTSRKYRYAVIVSKPYRLLKNIIHGDK